MKNNKLIGDFMDIRNTGLSVYKESAYKYHESWDWLMPVVERIGDENLLSIDIDVAYDRVVEFIKEYNNE